MKFEMTNHIAFETENRKSAEKFYESVLGMKVTKKETGFTQFSNDKVNFYVADQGKCPGVMLDFLVQSQSDAINYLIENGCVILEQLNGDCFMRDPFGLVFNISQKK